MPPKPPYPPEFRREAVQPARSAERSIAQVAGLSRQGVYDLLEARRAP
jgi:transposase-like protein